MHAALEQLYDNNAVQYQLSDDTKFDDDFFDKVADEIFQMGGYSSDYLTTPNGSALIEETSRIFDNAINAGIGYEPDPELQSALSQNAFVFSGFKTDKELQEVASMLKDENGDIVPFDEFKQKALGINQKYNVNYLQAEYNFAVQSAQMASKWQEFEKHKDFVNLQYRTAGDERVREEHRALDKTTLPVDDPFWKEYLPPLGWNCRCTVVEVLKDLQPVSNSAQAIKAGQMATSKPAQKIFRFNPGQELKLFPPKHPYLPKDCGNCSLSKDKKLSNNNKKQGCENCNWIKRLMEKVNRKKNDPNKPEWKKFEIPQKFVMNEAKLQEVKNNGWELPFKTAKEYNESFIGGFDLLRFDRIFNDYTAYLIDKKNDLPAPTKTKKTITLKKDSIKLFYKNNYIFMNREFSAKNVYHVNIRVNYKDNKIGSIITFELIKQYIAMGKSTITCVSSSNNGGYTWARLGFYATDLNEVKNIIAKMPDKYKKIYEDYMQKNKGVKTFPMSLIANEQTKKILTGSTWHGELKLNDEGQMTYTIIEYFDNKISNLVKLFI